MDTNGKRHVSMQAVADEAGVSKATVSKVLNARRDVSAGARAKVHAACAKLGYRLNPNIQDLLKRGVNGHSQNIAFVLTGVEFANPSYAGMVDGIAQGAQEHGLHLVLAKLSGCESNLYDLPPAIRDHRVAGILLSGVLSADLIGLMRELGLPFVLLGNYPKSITTLCGSVSVDTEGLMFLAVRELKARGKRKIAFFHEDTRNYYAQCCYESYRRALQAHGLVFEDGLLLQGEGGDFNALDLMESVFAGGRLGFDAIICLNYLASREVAGQIIAHAGRDTAGRILMTTVMNPNQRLPMPTLRGENLALKLAALGTDLLVEKLKHPQPENKHIAFTPTLVFHDV